MGALVDAARHVDQVDAGIRQQLRERRRVIDREAAVDVLFGGHAVTDREVRSDDLSDRAQHLEREASPILRGAAVVVGSSVAEGRDERPEEIAVRAVKVDHVETGGCDSAGSRGEALDDLVDLRDGQFPGHRYRREHLTWNDRRRDGLPLRHHGRGLPPAHVELDAELGPAGVHCVGRAAKRRDHVVAVTAHLVEVTQSADVDVGRLEHDQACTAALPAP